MGLFFLISGYFVPGAYDRKGAIRFLTDRLLRLGIPILFFALLVFPLTFYFAVPSSLSFEKFVLQNYLDEGYIEFGHLWFLVHLLIYDISYVIYCRIVRQTAQPRSEVRKIQPPNHQVIMTYLIVLAIVTFIVRIEYPIDQWEQLLGVIPLGIDNLRWAMHWATRSISRAFKPADYMGKTVICECLNRLFNSHSDYSCDSIWCCSTFYSALAKVALLGL